MFMRGATMRNSVLYQVGHYGLLWKFIAHKCVYHPNDNAYFIIDCGNMSHTTFSFLMTRQNNYFGTIIPYNDLSLFCFENTVDDLKKKVISFFDSLFSKINIQPEGFISIYSGSGARNAFSAYLSLKRIPFIMCDLGVQTILQRNRPPMIVKTPGQQIYTELMNETDASYFKNECVSGIIWFGDHPEQLSNSDLVVDTKQLINELNSKDLSELIKFFNLDKYSSEEESVVVSYNSSWVLTSKKISNRFFHYIFKLLMDHCVVGNRNIMLKPHPNFEFDISCLNAEYPFASCFPAYVPSELIGLSNKISEVISTGSGFSTIVETKVFDFSSDIFDFILVIHKIFLITEYIGKFSDINLLLPNSERTLVQKISEYCYGRCINYNPESKCVLCHNGDINTIVKRYHPDSIIDLDPHSIMSSELNYILSTISVDITNDIYHSRQIIAIYSTDEISVDHNQTLARSKTKITVSNVPSNLAKLIIDRDLDRRLNYYKSYHYKNQCDYSNSAICLLKASQGNSFVNEVVDCLLKTKDIDCRKKAYDLTLSNAIQNDSISSWLMIARMYKNGIGVDKNIPMAYDCYWYLSNKDNSYVNELITLRLSMDKDYRDNKLFDYCLDSVESNPAISLSLARLLSKGVGVEKNLEKSIQWYDRYLKLDYSVCSEYINVLLELSTADSERKGYELCSSAIYIDSKSMVSLSHFYKKGIVVQKDLNKALEYLEMAVSSGVSSAKYEYYDLLLMNSSKESIKKLVELLECDAVTGDPRSIGRLARLYRDGIGVDKDVEHAISLMKEASDKGILTWDIELVDLLLSTDDDKKHNDAITHALKYKNEQKMIIRLARAYSSSKYVYDFDKSVYYYEMYLEKNKSRRIKDELSALLRKESDVNSALR